MKKALLLPCLLLLAACGGAEPEQQPAPSTEAAPASPEQSSDGLQASFWYTCNLPCRTGYCPTSSIYYPDCAPYGSTTRYTCTPCTGGGEAP